jgi:hypothetical protein
MSCTSESQGIAQSHFALVHSPPSQGLLTDLQTIQRSVGLDLSRKNQPINKILWHHTSSYSSYQTFFNRITDEGMLPVQP